MKARDLALHLVGSDQPLSHLLARELQASVATLLCHFTAAKHLDFSAARSSSLDSVLVYLAAERGPLRERRVPVPKLTDALDVLVEASAAGIAHAVVVASAALHVPHHHHPGHVDEDRVAPRCRDHPVSGPWWQFEDGLRRAQASPADLPTVTLLRPTAVPVAGGQDLFSFALDSGRRGRFTRISAGYDPSLQILSPADLARAIRAAALQRTGGTYHVAPTAVLPLRRALRRAGKRALPMPAVPLPKSRHKRPKNGDHAYLRYPWTVSDARIRRQLGVEPRYSSEQALAALRRRELVTGEPTASKPSARSSSEPSPEPDAFGLDADYIERHRRWLLRFLHDVWWRIEVEGIDQVPTRGKVVLTGVHRGFMPWDGVMTLHQLAHQQLDRQQLGRQQRYPRFLIHPSLVKQPFLCNFMTKLGGVLACQENADWVLDHGGGLLGIFPEGIRGAFRPYRDATTLGRMGRHEFVKIALRHQAPIVPYVTVGSAEIFPVLRKLRWSWWERFTEWPCFPIAPPFPLLPIPLPSKWHTRYLEPIHLAGEYPPEAADDIELVRHLSGQVKQRLQDSLQDLHQRRRHIFFGSIFDRPSNAENPPPTENPSVTRGSS